MDIGDEEPAIIIEPVEDPFELPDETPTEAPVELPHEEPVEVPVGPERDREKVPA